MTHETEDFGDPANESAKFVYRQARDRIQELDAENVELSKEIVALREDLEGYVAAANTYVNELSGVHAGTHVIVPVEPDLKVLKSMRASYELFSDMDKVYRAALSATKETG